MSATASRERQHKEGVKLMSTTQGKFVWYDLMTSDCKTAESFYRSVIGWDAKDSGMADRSYTLFSAGPMMVGGMMPIPEEARAMGARLAWNGARQSSWWRHSPPPRGYSRRRPLQCRRQPARGGVQPL